MVVTEYFEFRKVLRVENNAQESRAHTDISTINTPESKIDSAIRSMLVFLTNCGFTEDIVYPKFVGIANEFLSHPDADDFTLKSQIEGTVQNPKELENFLSGIKDNINLYYDSSPNNIPKELKMFVEELFRSWLLTHTPKSANLQKD